MALKTRKDSQKVPNKFRNSLNWNRSVKLFLNEQNGSAFSKCYLVNAIYQETRLHHSFPHHWCWKRVCLIRWPLTSLKLRSSRVWTSDSDHAGFWQENGGLIEPSLANKLLVISFKDLKWRLLIDPNEGVLFGNWQSSSQLKSLKKFWTDYFLDLISLMINLILSIDFRWKAPN